MKIFRYSIIACLITGATAGTLVPTAGPTTTLSDSTNPTTGTLGVVTTSGTTSQTQTSHGTTATTSNPTAGTTGGVTTPGTTAQRRASTGVTGPPNGTRSGTTAGSLTTGSSNVTTAGPDVSPTQTSTSDGLSETEKVVFIILGVLVGVAVLFCFSLGCCRLGCCKLGNGESDSAGNGHRPNGHVPQNIEISLQDPRQGPTSPANSYLPTPLENGYLIPGPSDTDTGHVDVVVDVHPTTPRSPKPHNPRISQSKQYNYERPKIPPRPNHAKRKQVSEAESETPEPVDSAGGTGRHGAEYSTTLPTNRTPVPGDTSSDTERDKYKELPRRPKRAPSSPHPRKKAGVSKPPLPPKDIRPRDSRRHRDDRRSNDHRERKQTDRHGNLVGDRSSAYNAGDARRHSYNRSPGISDRDDRDKRYNRNPNFKPQHSPAHRRRDARDELQLRQDRNYDKQVRTLDRDIMPGDRRRRRSRSSSRSRQVYYSGTDPFPSGDNWSYGPSVNSETLNNRPNTSKGRRDKEKRISTTLERGPQDGNGRLWRTNPGVSQYGNRN